MGDMELLKRLEGVLRLINGYTDNEGYSLDVVKDEIIDIMAQLEPKEGE